jgi:CRP-like cAMP-binding protein
MLLNEFAAGDIFGAIGQPDTAAQEADVLAVQAMRTALFAALDFLGLLERYGCIGLAVSRMLVRQLQAINTRMVEEVILSAQGRVCAELLRMAEGSQDNRRISPPPVMAHLALRVHSARETVSRIVSGLERRGLVRREPDALVLVSLRQLRDTI